jgi:alginate O-acetyltransferase complex protein AlgI
MTIVGLPFVAIALAGVLLLRVPLLQRWRVQLLAGFSVVFAASASGSFGDALCLAGMAATGWIFMQIVACNKHPALLAAGIGCIVGEFLVFRQLLPHVPAPAWLLVGRTIGLSYVMFRVIHLVVDVHGDEVGRGLSPGQYIWFLFCYLTFLAGPIQRVQDFLAGVDRRGNTSLWQDVITFLPAISAGYVKYTIIAAGFFALFNWSQERGTGLPLPAVHAIGWLTFAAYLYTNFSGYSEVVRGLGGIIGLALPQNFDQPLATTNCLDFWSRWHISLSEWFKLYVFSPLVKEMIAAVGDLRWVPLLGAVGYFVTFFLMGLWHGVSWRFVFYGICLGAGVSVNKLYQNALLRRLGRPAVAALARRPLYIAAARALALTFIIVMLGFLWVPAASVNDATAAGWAAAAGMTGAFVAALVVAAPPVASHLRAWQIPAIAPGVSVGMQAAAVVIYVVVLGLPVPPLLYQFF